MAFPSSIAIVFIGVAAYAVTAVQGSNSLQRDEYASPAADLMARYLEERRRNQGTKQDVNVYETLHASKLARPYIEILKPKEEEIYERNLPFITVNPSIAQMNKQLDQLTSRRALNNARESVRSRIYQDQVSELDPDAGHFAHNLDKSYSGHLARRNLDQIGGGHLVRNIAQLGNDLVRDQIGGGLVRNLDQIGGGHLLRSLSQIDNGPVTRRPIDSGPWLRNPNQVAGGQVAENLNQIDDGHLVSNLDQSAGNLANRFAYSNVETKQGIDQPAAVSRRLYANSYC